MKHNRFNKSSGVMNDLIWWSWAIYPEGEWMPGALDEVLKYYFSLLILKMHIICVLSSLRYKSMCFLIKARVRMTKPWLHMKWVEGSPPLSFGLATLEIHKLGLLCMSFWWMPRAFWHCANVRKPRSILLFKSPPESIRGGSMSICYLDMTLSLHKRKGRPLTTYLGCVCLNFYMEQFGPNYHRSIHSYILYAA